MATNALLERKGEPTVLVITRGFADAIRIAYQDRPRIFDRQIVRPEMLYSRVIEADERIQVEKCASKLAEAANGTDRAYISGLVEELNRLSTPFAEKIMDYAIGRALEKKSVEELS